MLIKPGCKILKAINYSCIQSQETNTIDLMVYFNNRVNDLDLHESVRQLKKDGLITASEHNGYWQNITPTYEGRHYKQYAWIATKETFLKSFIFPVCVSVATTLLTLFLKSLF